MFDIKKKTFYFGFVFGILACKYYFIVFYFLKYKGGKNLDRKNKSQDETTGVLGFIERVGNKLPHPVVLFIILTAFVIVLSHVLALLGVEVTYFNAADQEHITVEAVSLLDAAGINHIFNSAVENFTDFAPLGTVLVTMLGVGVAEWTGLISSAMQRLLANVPNYLLSIAVIFAGVMSNIASDVGYVVIVPLGAVIFAAAGRHPIAGLAAAFAGVSGGFSANLLPGPLDALMVGIAKAALGSAGIEYNITVTANWYFMMASTVLLVVVGTFVTDKIVEPRLGTYTGDYQPDDEPLTAQEKKGLRNAFIVLVIYVAIMGFLMFGPNALFQSFDEEMGRQTLNKFLEDGLLFGLFLLFTLPGLAYGITVSKVKSSEDFVEGMADSMKTMSGYIVLAFFASQLINYFEYSNIGTILAKSGADLLEAINLVGLPLLVGFILLTALINLFIGSASAKWTLLSPIFSPMFYELNITPEATLIAYRIADSATNIISPLMSYFAMVLVFMERYDEEAGLGTLISIMLIYSVIFLVSWIILFVVWYLLGLPLGPGAPVVF